MEWQYSYIKRKRWFRINIFLFKWTVSSRFLWHHHHSLQYIIFMDNHRPRYHHWFWNFSNIYGTTTVNPTTTSTYTLQCTGTGGSSVNNVSNSTNWTWNCNGSGGGTNASCIEARPINGACGTANGATVTFAPTSNLCSYTSVAPTVTGSGPWNWQCLGTGPSSTDDSCSASKAAPFCGDTICTLPETLLSCPRDCKGKVKQF